MKSFSVLLPLLLMAGSAFALQPKMSISSPHGGEAYVDGQPQILVYGGKTKFKTMEVDLSRDGGATWTMIGTINNVRPKNHKLPFMPNQMNWTANGVSSSQCLIRMIGMAGSGKHKQSFTVVSGMFAIVGADGALNGSQGPQGDTGPQGPIGLTGPQGAQGIQGVQGVQGDVGPMGPVGADGAVGPQGPQGIQGIPGNDGADGAVGPQGPQGIQGVAGPVGPQGPQGDIGSMGPQGAQGLQGPAGPQGPAGVAGPAGADGTDGAQGPAGPAGPQGVAGPTGPAGPAGPQGDQGPAGPAGPAGPQGAVGPQGPAGPAGPTGPQGPAGAQGPQGPNGPTVSFINTASVANATIDSSKHNGQLVINDPNIRGPNNVKGRSQIFLQFSTSANTAGIVSVSYGGLADGTITVFISSQNYALNISTDNIDYQIINAQ